MSSSYELHALIPYQNQGLSKLQLALFVAESRVSFYVDSAFLLYKEHPGFLPFDWR